MIQFEGEDLSKWKSKELAKHLAILTQHNNVQMKLTVRELVSFGRFPYSGSRLTDEDHGMVDKAIAYMEAGQDRHPGPPRDQLRRLLLRLYLCFPEW